MTSILLLFCFAVFLASLLLGLFVRYIDNQRKQDRRKMQEYQNSQEFLAQREKFVQSIKNKRSTK